MCPHCHSALVGYLEGLRPEYLDQTTPRIMLRRNYTCLECGHKWEGAEQQYHGSTEVDNEDTLGQRRNVASI